MPDIPAKAVLDLAKRKLFIDDEEFPYEMTAPGPVLANGPDLGSICTVTLSFFVEAIEALPIPERSEAECQADLHIQAAVQNLTQATEGGDPAEIDAARARLAIAKDLAKSHG